MGNYPPNVANQQAAKHPKPDSQKKKKKPKINYKNAQDGDIDFTEIEKAHAKERRKKINRARRLRKLKKLKEMKDAECGIVKCILKGLSSEKMIQRGMLSRSCL
ncbi:unnamed protein product [Moneuplotes crassus]|uniref:Uncharacterized protein n=1 Tax=Euplotes crassus TaxID=5936 RepID=A0AAD1U6M9_EUPCR|nr:unnamed protein product [Moneuplotes crassus]